MTSVLSANLFALLGDDDDIPAPKSTPKQAAAEPAAKSQKEKPEQRNERSDRGGERGRGGRGRGGGRGDGERGRGGNRGGRGDGEYRPRTRRDEDGNEIQRAPRFQESTEDGFERKEGNYRPRGNRRGGPFGRGTFRGQREFDRQSGNNWEDSEKKEVAGKGTWGDAVESQVIESEAKVKDEVVPDATVESEGFPAEEPKQEKKEEEQVGKTLAEYQAELAAKRAILSAVSIRAANEGADDAKWGDSVKYSRPDDDEPIFAGKEKVKKEKVKERSVKVSVDIEQRFSDEGRRGSYGGRGGRGRGRGGDERRGRSGPRGGKQQVLNINDETAFPSLSK